MIRKKILQRLFVYKSEESGDNVLYIIQTEDMRFMVNELAKVFDADALHLSQFTTEIKSRYRTLLRKRSRDTLGNTPKEQKTDRQVVLIPYCQKETSIKG